MRPKFIIKYQLYERLFLLFDTQENLAQEIHMDPSYLSKILRKKQPVSIRNAYRISKALNAEVTDLFEVVINKSHK